MKLSELTEKRRKHVVSCNANNDKSHQIIADLYSDPSHFIYEILQNADDAQASEIRFTLTKQELKIIHNGEIQFDFDDIESITTIGSSTKKDDINAIGKFGAGFKSVFAVTKTPQIHSGGYHFEIQDFIVPKEIENFETNDETIIILPLNHTDLDSSQAYTQISNKLQTLESESLLFLHHFKEIKWNTEESAGYYLAKDELLNQKAKRFYVLTQQNNEDKQKYYLFFDKYIEIEKRRLKLSVAYRINKEDGKEKISPINDAKLYVFFPTNERVGLKFLLHAPYKTTPNRETIPFADEQNKFLTKELANLVVQSLSEIKCLGFLNTDFLTILPFTNEEHCLYAAIYNSIKSALSTDALLPTANGQYAEAEKTLLAGRKELSKLLNTEDIQQLFNKEYWLSTEITTSNKTKELRDYLKKELYVREIEFGDFAKVINTDFIIQKSDEWIIEFYEAISNNQSLYQEKTCYSEKGILRDKPILRLSDGVHANPDDENGRLQVYLPSEQESGFKTVKNIFVENEKSKDFLVEKLRLKRPNKVAEIKEFIAPKYRKDNPGIQHDTYVKDLRKTIEIWKIATHEEKKEIEEILKETTFIMATDYKGDVVYKKPYEVYLPEVELKQWFNGNEEDEVYFVLDSLQIDEFKDFLVNLGVYNEPHIWGKDNYGDVGDRDSKRHCYARGISGFNPEFRVKGLEFSLNHINLDRSLLIFSLSLKYAKKLHGIVEESSRQGFDGGSHYKKKDEFSFAGKLLTEHRWFYDQKGNLIKKPHCEITLEDLHGRYNKEHENVDKLIKALGLKPDEIKTIEEKTGGKFIPAEEVAEYEAYKRQLQEKAVNESGEERWKPECDSEEAPINLNNTPDIIINTEDLSNQYNDNLINSKNETDSLHTIENTNKKTTKTKYSKEIGEWGEQYVKRFLDGEYPQEQYKVIWLNQNGNVGKGYDFVIKDWQGNEIKYYEVKSKTSDDPELIEITGTQWEWARKLYNEEKGENYIIIAVPGAGTANAKIKLYINPVKLWKEGKMKANPVNLEL